MERMSAKKEQSAAVELERKLSPLEKVARVALIIMGGLAICRLLKILDARLAYHCADLVQYVGVVNLECTLSSKRVKTCAGLSFQSLQLTALHLAVRISYSLLVETDMRAFDIMAFCTTLCTISLVHNEFKSSYVDNQDNFNMLYLVIPCALLSLAIHPAAFCGYVQCVSLLPQLLLMRRRKIVEPFTAKYVFMLGVHRLLYLENWVIEVLLTRGQSFLGYNMWWAFMDVLFKIVNGFILADFCYYYLTTDFDEQGMRLPSDLV